MDLTVASIDDPTRARRSASRWFPSVRFPSVDAPRSASDFFGWSEHLVGCCHLSGF